METKGGKCIIFSAPSGAGKTTIVHRLIKEIPSLSFSVSACSREARPNEKHGIDYYFLSSDEFKANSLSGKRFTPINITERSTAR